MTSSDRTSLGIPAALSASVCFGVGNLAYRFGEGNAVAIAGSRCLVGAVLMLPVLVCLGSADTTSILRSRDGRLSVLVSAVNLVITALMLRMLTGPQAGLAIATTPLFILAVRRAFVEHKRVPAMPLAVCVLASALATFTGGLGEVTAVRITLIAAFVLVNGLDILCTERARKMHSASALVGLSMALGAFFGYAAVVALRPEGGVSTTGYLAALAIGVLGTCGRWLRGIALPSVGSAVVASTAQIAALITALGGVILLNDSVEWLAICLSMVAASSAVWAVLAID